MLNKMVLGSVFTDQFYYMIQRSDFVCGVRRLEVASVRSSWASLITISGIMLREEATILVRIVLRNVYHQFVNNLRVDKSFHQSFEDD